MLLTDRIGDRVKQCQRHQTMRKDAGEGVYDLPMESNAVEMSSRAYRPTCICWWLMAETCLLRFCVDWCLVNPDWWDSKWVWGEVVVPIRSVSEFLPKQPS